MKIFTIELEDDLAFIYDDISKMNNRPIEVTLQNTLKNAMRAFLNRRVKDKDKHERQENGLT